MFLDISDRCRMGSLGQSDGKNIHRRVSYDLVCLDHGIPRTSYIDHLVVRVVHKGPRLRFRRYDDLGHSCDVHRVHLRGRPSTPVPVPVRAPDGGPPKIGSISL